MSKNIYLDYNATTPLDKEVIDAITSSCLEAWGNASCGYDSGILAKELIAGARDNIGNMINCDQRNVIFVSGGTEANNTVLHSIVESHTGPALPHIITTNVEHDSIKKPLLLLQSQKKIELTLIPVQPSGAVLPNDVTEAIKENTKLITIMHANNETGVIQPVAAITKLAREKGKQIHKSANRIPLIHTDAAQTIGKIKVDVKDLDVDYLTVVGHKFYGPRIGALFIRDLEQGQTPFVPMFHGGGQERGYRSGTENTPMIAGLGRASKIVKDNLTVHSDHMRKIRDKFENLLCEHFGEANVDFNGKHKDSERLPNTSNFSLTGPYINKGGQRLLSAAKIIQASVGSACHANVEKPSAVLMSLGIEEAVARNAIRLSVGAHTSENDIVVAAQVLFDAANTL